VSPRLSGRGAIVALLCLLFLTACGSDERGSSDPAEEVAPSPADLPTAVADKCGVESAAEVSNIEAADGSVLTGAVVGEGDQAMVLLHQTSPSGYCGWVQYADWAAEHGVRVVLVDLCGWGNAVCSDELTADPEAQVRLMVDWARDHGASRVAVVGASMGGAIALGVADAAGADAVVDLSGPETWQGVPDAEEAAAATDIPLLVATAPSDPGVDDRVLERAVERSPATPKRFIATSGGHGRSMLYDGSSVAPEWRPLARTVLEWALSDAA
jgi:pimeloyl-ACP methyl ester carboxylesterase